MNTSVTLGRTDTPQFKTFWDIVNHFFDIFQYGHISIESKKEYFWEFKSCITTHMSIRESIGKYSEAEMLKILYWIYKYLYNKNYHSLPEVVPKTLDDAWMLIWIQIEQFWPTNRQMDRIDPIGITDVSAQKSVSNTVYRVVDRVLSIVSWVGALISKNRGEEVWNSIDSPK